MKKSALSGALDKSTVFTLNIWSNIKRKEFAPQGSNFLPFLRQQILSLPKGANSFIWEEILFKGRLNNLDRIASPESVSFPLKVDYKGA